jgi:DNA repair protein RecN (Recombination protein N)
VIRELHVEGLGVIEGLDLELHPGLNVLTGETGAGKTMITVGLALALGRRASVSLVRPGAAAARVQVRVDAPAATLDEGWVEDGELVLARSISADGRSTARIGGQLAPVSALADLAGDLVEMHGQHEGTRLLARATQTEFLDRFAGAAHLATVADLAEAHARRRAARDALAAIVERERDRAREVDLLGYQVGEIEAVGPRPGELSELDLEEARLTHAERLVERASSAGRALSADADGAGGEAARDALGSAAAELRAAAELDPGAGELAARAADLVAAASELARDVRAYREGLELDPDGLDVVRERLAAVRGLLRKYGEGEEDALAYLAEARGRLERLAGAEEDRARLEDEVAELDDRVRSLAAAVSGGRAEAAPRLATALDAELRELEMAGAHVDVALVPEPEPGGGGAEHVELRFAGGAGQPELPFSRVASGGELSRTMLACRSVLVDLDDVPTLVFDEVDAGIGGRAGVAVGRRLAALGRSRQVLVVTHLPQIASFADRHVVVEKGDGRASVAVLDDAGRVRELTRMLAGLPGSDAAATHAEELLAEAGRAKAGR